MAAAIARHLVVCGEHTGGGVEGRVSRPVAPERLDGIAAVLLDREVHEPLPAAVAGRVAWISVAPVKSMALVSRSVVELGPAGIADDRRFGLLDDGGRLVNGKRAGHVVAIVPDHDPATGQLVLRFPDGRRVAGQVALGEPAARALDSAVRPAHVVEGPWSAAISAWLGLAVRLVRFDETGIGLDRGPEGGAVSLVSSAALATLAAEAGQPDPLDARRFRMTFGVEGIPAHAEDRWLGRPVRLGGAVVEPQGNVGRCAVTTQDPDSGVPDVDTLGALARSRGGIATTEALPFGIWARVLQPGRVALGDPVWLEDEGF